MRALAAIYTRELRAYFLSPIFYVLLVVFQVVSGFFYFLHVAGYMERSLMAARNPMAMQVDLQAMLVGPVITNMAFLMMLISPILTMRLLSEEKRSGTLELLLSYPISDTVVVLGKFLAVWTIYALMVLLSSTGMVMLFGITDPHWPAMLSGYLGLLLVGAAFLSVGVLASAITENQIVAATNAFPVLVLFWVLGFATAVAPPGMGRMLESLSTLTHMEKLTQGLIDTADLAYFVLFTAFFLFTAIRVLEAKRWKA